MTPPTFPQCYPQPPPTLLMVQKSLILQLYISQPSKIFFFFGVNSKPFLSSSGKLPLTNILPNPVEEKMSLLGSNKKPFLWERKEL